MGNCIECSWCRKIANVRYYCTNPKYCRPRILRLPSSCKDFKEISVEKQVIRELMKGPKSAEELKRNIKVISVFHSLLFLEKEDKIKYDNGNRIWMIK